jgi:hypothetical protein
VATGFGGSVQGDSKGTSGMRSGNGESGPGAGAGGDRETGPGRMGGKEPGEARERDGQGEAR